MEGLILHDAIDCKGAIFSFGEASVDIPAAGAIERWGSGDAGSSVCQYQVEESTRPLVQQRVDDDVWKIWFWHYCYLGRVYLGRPGR